MFRLSLKLVLALISSVCLISSSMAISQSSAFSFPSLPFSAACPQSANLDLTFSFGSLTIPGGQNFLRDHGEEISSFVCINASSFVGEDVLGQFEEQQYTWTAASARWITSVRFYVGIDVVVMSQQFPDGLEDAATNNPDAVITGFPSWNLLPNTSSSSPPSFVHFSGYMAGNYPQYGFWEHGTRGIFLDGGMANSGVVSIYDPATGDAVAISPFSEFMSSSIEVRRNAAATTAHWGIMGNVSRVPPGFESAVVLAGKRSGGVNGAVRFWGEALRTWFGKGDQQASRARDITLQRLGYSTDNGAYYYYYTGDHAANYQELLAEVKAYAASAGLPYGHVQFDSWWYYRADGSDKSGVPLGGVTNWTAMPSIFPSGLPFVFKNVTHGMPVMAHNRYWATNNVYAANPLTPIGPSAYRGPTFNFTWGEEAGLPTSVEFWDNLFSINSDWGLSVYEQDWLCTTVQHMPVLQQQVFVGGDWLRQMGEGAYRHGLSVQYCMSYPRHVLQSVEIPAVTQARASNDYQSQAQIFDYDQWRIGESSLWVAAIGICPSKDSFWTMPNSQFDPHYDPFFNVSERRNRLESVSATMSNGVVQISDRIGFSNRELILRSCMADGTILSPDFSATPSESCFASRATAAANLLFLQPVAPCGAFVGAVHGTSTDFGAAGTFFYVLSVSLLTSYNLTGSDICRSWGYKARFCANASQAMWLAYEANTTSSLHLMSTALTEPLQLSTSDEYSFQYFTLAPVPLIVQQQRHGFVFLGEKNKWIGASSARFTSITTSGGPTSLRVELRGASGEDLTLLVARLPGLTVTEVNCSVGETLQATLEVGADGSSKCS